MNKDAYFGKPELLLVGFYKRHEITFVEFNLKMNLVAIGFSWEEAKNEIGFLLEKKYIRKGHINGETTFILNPSFLEFLDMKGGRRKNAN